MTSKIQVLSHKYGGISIISVVIALSQTPVQIKTKMQISCTQIFVLSLFVCLLGGAQRHFQQYFTGTCGQDPMMSPLFLTQICFSYKQHFATFYVSLYDIYTINTVKQQFLSMPGFCHNIIGEKVNHSSLLTLGQPLCIHLKFSE